MFDQAKTRQPPSVYDPEFAAKIRESWKPMPKDALCQKCGSILRWDVCKHGV